MLGFQKVESPPEKSVIFIIFFASKMGRLVATGGDNGHSPNTPAKTTGRELPPPEIFSGWKQIANYLGKAVRSVQRYERELALPVRRPSGKSVGSVIATKAELDSWISASPARHDAIPKLWPMEQTNRTGAQFLQVDSEIALTFSSLALQTKDEERRRRSAQTARKAYDTIVKLKKNIALTDPEKDRLDANLLRLKGELQTLGV